MFTNDNPGSAPSISLAPTLTTFMTIGGTTLAAPGITKPISNVGFYSFDWNPTLPIFFVADGGTLVTDSTLRYLSGILDPLDRVNEQAQTLTAIGTTNFALGTTNAALGTTNVALGTTSVALGITSVAIGTTVLAGETLIYAQNISLSAQSVTLTGFGVSIYAVAQTLLAQGLSMASSPSLIAYIAQSIGSTSSLIGDLNTNPDTIYGYLKRAQEFNEGDQTFSKLTGTWTITDRTGATTIAIKALSNNNTQVTKT